MALTRDPIYYIFQGVLGANPVLEFLQMGHESTTVYMEYYGLMGVRIIDSLLSVFQNLGIPLAVPPKAVAGPSQRSRIFRNSSVCVLRTMVLYPWLCPSECNLRICRWHGK